MRPYGRPQLERSVSHTLAGLGGADGGGGGASGAGGGELAGQGMALEQDSQGVGGSKTCRLRSTSQVVVAIVVVVAVVVAVGARRNSTYSGVVDDS